MTILSKFVNYMKSLPDAKNQISDGKQIAKQYRTWRIKMFLGVYVGYMVYYFNRKNLSYAAPSLISELGITKIEFGILGSVMSITYGIGKFLAGMLADKCNIRTFMAFGLIGSSIINLFFGFLTSLPLLTLFWGLNGGLQSMGYPPAVRTIVYWFSPSEKTTKYTIWSSSHRLGTAILGIIAGVFIAIGYWRAVFYIPGIIGLITGISLLFTLTDKPTSLGLPPVEIYRNDTTSTIVKSNLTHWQILKKYIFTNLNMWILAISGIFVYFSFGFILDWSTLFMVSRGISKSKAAYLLSLLPFVGCFGGITGGILIDKFFKGRAVPVIVIFLFGLFISFVGIYKFTTSTTAWWIIGFFLSLAGFFSDGPQILGSMVASNLVPTESVGAGCGFVGLFHYIGTFLSGICIALIIEKWDWYGGFIIASLSCLVAMLSTALIWNKEKTKI